MSIFISMTVRCQWIVLEWMKYVFVHVLPRTCYFLSIWASTLTFSKSAQNFSIVLLADSFSLSWHILFGARRGKVMSGNRHVGGSVHDIESCVLVIRTCQRKWQQSIQVPVTCRAQLTLRPPMRCPGECASSVSRTVSLFTCSHLFTITHLIFSCKVTDKVGAVDHRAAAEGQQRCADPNAQRTEHQQTTRYV